MGDRLSDVLESVHLSVFLTINQTQLQPVEETKVMLEEIAAWTDLEITKYKNDIKGTFQITLIHDEPDLLVHVPPLEM